MTLPVNLPYDIAQSFTLESSVVDNAVAVHITSIELYFNSKPESGKSATGIYEPGASIHLCPMKNDEPDLSRVIQATNARLEYSSILTSGTSDVSTKFVFSKPILVSTDASYCFLVSFDGSDNDFQLWQNKSGETLVNTSTQSSASAGYNDGNFYKITNGYVQTKTTDSDLKFKVNIAKFSTLTQTYSFREKKYEYFQVFANTLSGNFKVGEYVWQNVAASTGTLSVTKTRPSPNSVFPTIAGTGTALSTLYAAGDYIVISDGTAGNTAIRNVVSVTNATSITLDEYPHFTNASAVHYKTAVAQVYLNDNKSDHIFLIGSNANSTIYFANNSWVKGEDSQARVQIRALKDLPVQRVLSEISTITPGFTSAQTSINFANSLYQTSDVNQIKIPVSNRQFIDTYPAIIGTRSYVVTNSNTSLWGGNGGYTVNGQITFTTTNQYSSPYLEEDDLDIFTYRYELNNDATDEEIGLGNATTRYVSKQVVLGDQQDAEDLVVFATSYLPQNTSIKIYGKVLNSEDYESLDSKNWSLMEETVPLNYVSSSANKNDVVEKQYKIPFYYSDETVLSGYALCQTSNAVIATTSNIQSSVTAGQSLVRVYNEGAPNNFFVDLVTAANSSTITVANPVTNSSFATGGLKIGLISNNNKYSAFINPQNRNIVRYYTNSLSPKDTYKIFLMKIVLLSTDKFRAPFVKDLRAIAVSA